MRTPGPPIYGNSNLPGIARVMLDRINLLQKREGHLGVEVGVSRNGGHEIDLIICVHIYIYMCMYTCYFIGIIMVALIIETVKQDPCFLESPRRS